MISVFKKHKRDTRGFGKGRKPYKWDIKKKGNRTRKKNKKLEKRRSRR